MRSILRSLLIISILVCGLLISWCWKDSPEEQSSEFIQQQLGWGFTAQLPSSFDRVPVWLVENKQIVNQLLSSWKETTQQLQEWGQENPQPVFDPNLVVTQSRIDTKLTSAEYAKWSLQKLLSDVSGVTVDSRTNTTIDCSWTSTDAQRIELTVTDSYYADDTSYYLSQLYVVKDNAWYLLSMADTDQERGKNRFDSVVESVWCTQSQAQQAAQPAPLSDSPSQ